MRKSEVGLKAFWDTKWTNIHIIEVPEGREREQEKSRKLIQRYMAGNFHNLGKETNIQIQETQSFK